MSNEHWLNDTGWEYRSTRTTTCPTATLSTHIPYGVVCDSTLASVVKGQQLPEPWHGPYHPSWAEIVTSQVVVPY